MGQARIRWADGLPPTDDAEHEWEKLVREDEMLALYRASKVGIQDRLIIFNYAVVSNLVYICCASIYKFVKSSIALQYFLTHMIDHVFGFLQPNINMLHTGMNCISVEPSKYLLIGDISFKFMAYSCS